MKRLICWLRGHDAYLDHVATYTDGRRVQVYRCRRCEQIKQFDCCKRCDEMATMVVSYPPSTAGTKFCRFHAGAEL